MQTFIITKDGQPTKHKTTDIMAAIVAKSFLEEVNPKHIWDIEASDSMLCPYTDKQCETHAQCTKCLKGGANPC